MLGAHLALRSVPANGVRWVSGTLRPYAGLRRAVDQFYGSLTDGGPLPASLEDGRRVVHWVEAVGLLADAAKRFIGENGSDAPGVYDLFQNHEHYSRRFMESYRATVKAQTVDIKEASRLYELTRQDARPLRQTRQTMRAQGLTPPPLPDGLPDYFGFDTDEVA